MSDENKTVDRLPDGRPVPEGVDFLDLVFHQEMQCHTETRETFKDLGEKAPRCLSDVGTVLSLLDRLSSCRWGCAGGDHLLEYVTGRAVSSARAAIRLMFAGYYDESLALTRNIGEIANLYSLFCANPTALDEWRSADDKVRRQEFCPPGVRRRLESLSAPIPVSQERYAALCEVGTHVNPRTTPENHNVLGMPGGGASLQKAGFILALNELAVPLALTAVFATRLINTTERIRHRIGSAGRALAESIGGITILEKEKPWFQLHGQAADLIPALAKLIKDAPQGMKGPLQQFLLELTEGRGERR
jgi:hypothetical protein